MILIRNILLIKEPPYIEDWACLNKPSRSIINTRKPVNNSSSPASPRLHARRRKPCSFPTRLCRRKDKYRSYLLWTRCIEMDLTRLTYTTKASQRSLMNRSTSLDICPGKSKKSSRRLPSNSAPRPSR